MKKVRSLFVSVKRPPLKPTRCSMSSCDQLSCGASRPGGRERHRRRQRYRRGCGRFRRFDFRRRRRCLFFQLRGGRGGRARCGLVEKFLHRHPLPIHLHFVHQADLTALQPRADFIGRKRTALSSLPAQEIAGRAHLFLGKERRQPIRDGRMSRRDGRRLAGFGQRLLPVEFAEKEWREREWFRDFLEIRTHRRPAEKQHGLERLLRVAPQLQRVHTLRDEVRRALDFHVSCARQPGGIHLLDELRKDRRLLRVGDAFQPAVEIPQRARERALARRSRRPRGPPAPARAAFRIPAPPAP